MACTRREWSPSNGCQESTVRTPSGSPNSRRSPSNNMATYTEHITAPFVYIPCLTFHTRHFLYSYPLHCTYIKQTQYQLASYSLLWKFRWGEISNRYFKTSMCFFLLIRYKHRNRVTWSTVLWCAYEFCLHFETLTKMEFCAELAKFHEIDLATVHVIGFIVYMPNVLSFLWET